ncbi:MAG: hypothetical protein GY862_04675, partial [Gammaproteobacteria bacterium]|nr:hypothetical protein [Gammaproteobacteria bacterium]
EGGKVHIQAHRFSMADTAWIITASFNRGQGGAIEIYANDLYVSGRAAIAAGAFAEGKGGDVNVHVQHTASLSGAAVIASGTAGTGTGGRVSLHAGRIVITGAAAVSSASEGENRFVKQKERLSELPLSGGGDAGQVRIEADMLVLTDGAAIDSSSGGKGTAGDILIILVNLQMRDSRISTRAEQAHGGNITIKAGGLLALCRSAVTASVGGGAGNGGNITVSPAPGQFVMNKSHILAKAAAGHGGNIFIHAERFLQSVDSVVNASSALGIDGTVRMPAPEENIVDALVFLPTAFSGAPVSLKSCPARMAKDASRLTMENHGKLSTGPDDMF